VKLNGQVALITGGASGIGRAISILFAAEGAHVAVVDCNSDGLDQLQYYIKSFGGGCTTYVANVEDASSSDRLIEEVLDLKGSIDIIVTAAAVSQAGTLPEITESEWDRAFSINVKGTYLWIRSALPSMLQAGRGSIITISSQRALAAGNNNAVYVATKGAIISLTQAIALDYADKGIRANVLIPGAIQTPLSENYYAARTDGAEARERTKQRHPMKRFGKPEEVARAALFLASEDSSFTTGTQLRVDGGFLVG
jgi:NAD(P)-dependent dehydrogenase (short-subunit alcohol dehydrogenase family)